MSARLASEVARHMGKAALAAAIAASISSTLAMSTVLVCSPVAGLNTGRLWPDVDGTIWPLIQWLTLGRVPCVSVA